MFAKIEWKGPVAAAKSMRYSDLPDEFDPPVLQSEYFITKFHHPAFSGMAALPYFDDIDPSNIDVLLVTQYARRRLRITTTFKGRVFMTHATKAIYKLLLIDCVKVSKVSVEDMLYDEHDINRSMDKIEESENHLSLHWGADPINDMVSDSVLAMVLNISREMPKVVVDQNEEEVAKVILEIQTGEVEGENEGLKERVKTAFRRIQSAVRPNPSCFLVTLTLSSNGCHRISQEFHKILVYRLIEQG